MGVLPHNYDELFDQIDAGFFSGDSFRNEAALKEVEDYLGRWQREIVSIRECLAEEAKEEV